jgi:hypothetical protein
VKPEEGRECVPLEPDLTEKEETSFTNATTTTPPTITRGLTGAVVGNLTSPQAGGIIVILILLTGGAYIWVRKKAGK